MNALVIYDSKFGNTKKIAQTIGEYLNCQVFHVGDVNPAELEKIDLLIVGSPTHGGRPTPEIQRWMDGPSRLGGISIAAFDTRTERFSQIFGYASQRIARSLEEKGGKLLVSPEGFIVIKNKGPLKDGELERAIDWAKVIAEKIMIRK